MSKRFAKHMTSKNNKKIGFLCFNKTITIIALSILLVVGLVATTFSSYVSNTAGDNGSLSVEVENNVFSRSNKTDLADTKANVDLASTGGNHSGGYIYFIKPSNWSNVAFIVGHDSWWQTYKMTQLSGNLYYLNLKTAANGNWNGWNGWGFVDYNSTTNAQNDNTKKVWDKYKTYNNYNNLNNSYALNDGSTYICVGNSDNNNAFSVDYKEDGYDSLNSTTQTAYCYSTTTGGTSYTSNAAAGSLTVKTVKLNGNGTLASATTNEKSANSTSVSGTAVQGSSVTVTATAAEGYSFKGWYSSDTSTTPLESGSSYTYNAGTGNTSVYAKFEEQKSFNIGDVVYLETSSGTGWKNAGAKMFVAFTNVTDSSTAESNSAEMTQIAENLYAYKFTKKVSSSIRFWRAESATNFWNYSKSLSPSDNGNAIEAASPDNQDWNGKGTVTTVTINSLSAPTLTASTNDLTLGQSCVLTPQPGKLYYTVGNATTPTESNAYGLSYSYSAGSTNIVTGNTSNSYTWSPTIAGIYEVKVTATQTVTGAHATSNSVNVTVRPKKPTALTLNPAINTYIKGSGTSSDPYIVYSDSDFSLTANATVPSGVAHYCLTENGTYDDNDSFKPSLTSMAQPLPYTVYAKTYENSVYSGESFSGSAYYMVFHRLNDSDTGFSVSETEIDDTQSVTLYNAYVNNIDDAEKSHITQTYQISTDDVTYTNLGNAADSYTWTPVKTGEYYFRVKTVNKMTGQEVYSTPTKVTVVQSNVWYDITVTNASLIDGVAGTVTLKTGDTTINNNNILSNSPLTISIAKDSKYYFEYLKVDGGQVVGFNNYNKNIDEYLVYEHVKGDVEIEYKLVQKPEVIVKKPHDDATISFVYKSDEEDKSVTSAGTYYVDYNSSITYTITPSAGYYVNSLKGVTPVGEIPYASSVTGSRANVTSDIAEVNAVLNKNNTFTVNIAQDSFSSDGASMKVDDNTQSLGVAVPLNYNVESTVIVIPPIGCYAQVTDDLGDTTFTSEISTDGSATFKVKLTGSDKSYTVKFIQNPVITFAQPRHGSVYVTSGSGDNLQYYFNNDSVGYGTELTVHAIKEHSNSTLNNITVNGSAILGPVAETMNFTIYADSKVSATITVGADFNFDTIGSTEFGTKRVFFTDNNGWKGITEVVCYYGSSNNPTSQVEMTYKYTNQPNVKNERVYFADIPLSAKYVRFSSKNGSFNSTSAEIKNNSNGFWTAGSIANPTLNNEGFSVVYSDFVAVNSDKDHQQATTPKSQSAIFNYTSDFGDGVLSAVSEDGDKITYEFESGKLFIKQNVAEGETAKGYSLVKVTSSTTGMEKYYLVKYDDFEIVDFSGLRKIYVPNDNNVIQFNLQLNGGTIPYLANYFVSDSNLSNSYSGIGEVNNIQDLISSFTISYTVNNTMQGVKFYKVEASDSANHSATATLRTLFGTNQYVGKRALYFYNETNVNISKYNLRVCFKNADGTYTWSTMKKVGTTDYYHVVVPKDFETGSTVSFYLCNTKTFSNNPDDYDGVDASFEVYSYKSDAVNVPGDDSANLVYAVESIGSRKITGSFIEF
ncbi:MAG: InlB B-repeat-containing protein [Ruminococcus sp.]|nr:InlB B-repeat-containing protein [Ruminococcus sp.]